MNNFTLLKSWHLLHLSLFIFYFSQKNLSVMFVIFGSVPSFKNSWRKSFFLISPYALSIQTLKGIFIAFVCLYTLFVHLLSTFILLRFSCFSFTTSFQWELGLFFNLISSIITSAVFSFWFILKLLFLNKCYCLHFPKKCPGGTRIWSDLF